MFDLAPGCQVSRCSPLLLGLALSSLAMSTRAIWCHVVRSRDVQFRDFSARSNTKQYTVVLAVGQGQSIIPGCWPKVMMLYSWTGK